MFKVSDYEQSTGAYLKEIGGFKPLTKKDEMKLWRRLKKNPEDSDAKNKLITSNLKFVVSVANSYKGRGLSMSDLVAEGNMGLLKAYTKFDPKRDVKFISYSRVFCWKPHSEQARKGAKNEKSGMEKTSDASLQRCRDLPVVLR